MKESEQLIRLLSELDKHKEVSDVLAQIEEFEQYIVSKGIHITKRQLIISQDEKFLNKAYFNC